MLRNLTCMDTDQARPTYPHLCLAGGKGGITHQLVQRCSVACREPCKLTSWGPWGSCYPANCQQRQAGNVKGYQVRRREMTARLADSTTCDAKEEVRTCKIDSCFKWTVVSEGPCEVRGPGLCGAGKQARAVACVSWTGAPSNSSVDCSHLPRPSSHVSCHVACPADCITSTWSAWTSCPHQTCSTHSHHPRLPLKQRNRTILATAGSGGRSCPGNDALMEMSGCPGVAGQCEWFSWNLEPWAACETGQSCGPGTSTRRVNCVDNRGVRVPSWRCDQLSRPEARRSCQSPCPRHCQLSQWTDWSKCPGKCNTGGSGSGALIMETQRRERLVLVSPAHGGRRCQELLQVRPCPLLAGSCKKAEWVPGEWSNCTLPQGMTCGEGTRVRSLACIRSGSTPLPLTDCLSQHQATPSQRSPCQASCSSACHLSMWSEWSECPQSCGNTRRRTRTKIDESKCKNQNVSTEETKKCPCDKYTARPVGPWSQCLLLPPGIPVLQVSPVGSVECGAGKKYRRMDCIDSRGNLVHHSWCLGSSHLTESCQVPCPVDCGLSPWGEWGLCDSVCGPGLKNRTSKVVQLPNGSGRPCPGPTVEYAACDYPCENFAWSIGAWSQCNVMGGTCGKGIRRRIVRCIERVGESELVVLDNYCDALRRPESEVECDEPCPGHCVQGEWTSWTQCEQCQGGSRQSRVRDVLRSPGPGAPACPAIEETRPCVALHNCWNFSWVLTAWTSCRPKGGSSCGDGLQARGRRCVRSDGRPVESWLCHHLPAVEETEISCHVECPVDCRMSPWSPWDSSSCSCGVLLTNMTRTRSIVVPSSLTGRPCSGRTVESKPCGSKPCYAWHRSPWSQCDLQGATCGTGVMRRNVSCVMKPRNSVVHNSLCRPEVSDPQTGLMVTALMDLDTATNCYIGCSNDCTVSSWSEWSHCKNTACHPATTRGEQRRERRIVEEEVGLGKCPVHLEEIRSCLAPACFQFQWIVKNGNVFCQRSDGATVNSGCQSSVAGCGSHCWKVSHASCLSGHCVCSPGFLPQFTAHPQPRLSSCILANGNASSQTFQGREPKDDINLHYYPDDKVLNYWMFAMLSIGCIFIIFVGVSIYIMCKSTSRTEFSNPRPSVKP